MRSQYHLLPLTNSTGYWRSWKFNHLAFRKLIVIIYFSIPIACQAQESVADSIFLTARRDSASFKSISTLDPNRAAFLSAVLPGMGQIYNGQAWKVPLIYAGGIILGHYINYNHRIYSALQNAVIAESDDDPFTENPFSERFSGTTLTRNRDLFRRNRDYLMIIGVAYYVLNIVEAHVSAHLHEFEVNENLSMRISPSIQSTPLFSQALGVSVGINF